MGYGHRWDGDECVLYAEGEVEQAAMFGEQLTLRRRIEATVDGNQIRVRDEVLIPPASERKALADADRLAAQLNDRRRRGAEERRPSLAPQRSGAFISSTTVCVWPRGGRCLRPAA